MEPEKPFPLKLLSLVLLLLSLSGCMVRIQTGANQWELALGATPTTQSTYTPYPTFTPFPSLTPRPTFSPLPSYTPRAAYTLQPTYTLAPSITALKATTAKPTGKTSATSIKITPVVPTVKPGEVSQYARKVTASTEYGSTGWSAAQAAGAPNTTTCGDQSTAWASKASNTVDWLEAEFETLVAPARIIIYQTYNPGAITRVEVQNYFGLTWSTVYQAAAAVSNPCPAQLEIELKNIDYFVSRIRITLDQSKHNGWAEIDAVQLIGKIK